MGLETGLETGLATGLKPGLKTGLKTGLRTGLRTGLQTGLCGSQLAAILAGSEIQAPAWPAGQPQEQRLTANRRARACGRGRDVVSSCVPAPFPARALREGVL